MKTEDLVSIIVPVYNSERYIEKCVDSLLAQSWPYIEVILIDDGSTDRSREVIEARYGSEPRVRYRKKENGGVSSGRNMGLELARGAYLSFVDSDDWVAEDFVESAVRWIRAEGLDLILGGTVKVYPDHEEMCCADGRKDLWIYDDCKPVRFKVLSNGNFPPELRRCFTSGVVCRVFRRELLSRLRFDGTLVIGEDTVFNMESMERAGRVGVTGRKWYYYRMHEYSATARRRSNIQRETEELMRILYDKYADDPDFRKYLAVRGVQQFYGMLLLDVLHEESSLTPGGQCSYIHMCLKRKIWKEIFSLTFDGKLPANLPDRILYHLAAIHSSWGIWILVQLRVKGRAIADRKRSQWP